ncbi:hypothetical protein EMGBS4_11380 [Acidimicrobiaceae bacterium]|nr:hypothetical protein EMGBS4_11380 [Acidimicrobiaceae bacterium]
MPTYVYKFIDTGETIEVHQAFTDDALTEASHPSDGTMRPVKKVFTPVGITFKGGGFYKNDSAANSKSGSNSSTSTSAGTTASTSASTTASSSSGETSSASSDANSNSAGKTETKSETKGETKPKRKKAQPKANDPYTWHLAMQTKLIDQWYALCRDASRQRLVIISLSALSALFYLVTALGFTAGSSISTTQDTRYEIPAGFRAVAMQSIGPLPDLRAGDFVDVIIDATVALDRVLVIDVASQPGRSETVVLAVPLTSAPQIADAAALGIVALVLVG